MDPHGSGMGYYSIALHQIPSIPILWLIRQVQPLLRSTSYLRNVVLTFILTAATTAPVFSNTLFYTKTWKATRIFSPRLHHGWHFTKLDIWRIHYWVHHRLKGYGDHHWMQEYIYQMFFVGLPCYNLIMSLRLSKVHSDIFLQIANQEA